MFKKTKRGLRRKISNALRSDKYVIATGWINKNDEFHWFIETKEFPLPKLPEFSEEVNKFMLKELRRDSERIILDPAGHSGKDIVRQ